MAQGDRAAGVDLVVADAEVGPLELPGRLAAPFRTL